MKRNVAKPAWLVVVLFCLPRVAVMPVHAQTLQIPPYAAIINQVLCDMPQRYRKSR